MLTCPACKRTAGDTEERCAPCDRFLVVPDPDPPNIPEASLGYALSVLWQTSCSVGRGLQSPPALLPALNGAFHEFHEMLGEEHVFPIEIDLIGRCLTA